MQMNTKLIVATIVAVVVIAAAIALLWQRPPPAGQPTAPPQATQKTQTTTGQQTTPPPQTTTQTQTTTKVTTTSAQTTTERVPWAGLKGDILGGGSTFVNPQMQKWSRDFLAATKGGVRVNYQSIGSGAGAAQFIAGKLDFGASDVPMEATYDLYRIARYAYDVAETAETLGVKCPTEKVEKITQVVKEMTQKAVGMILRRDPAPLQEVRKLDDEVVDREYRQALAAAIQNPTPCSVVETLALRFLERASDHAVYMSVRPCSRRYSTSARLITSFPEASVTKA